MSSQDERPTTRLALDDIVTPTWSSVAAILERVSPAGTFILRLGLLEALHRVCDEMGHADARPELVTRARDLVEALAHLPWT